MSIEKGGYMVLAETIPDPMISSQDSQNALVEIKDLNVTLYRGNKSLYALRGVNLEVNSGEILGLVGESGSGKSILGLSMLGLLPTKPKPIISGQVVISGMNLVSASPQQLRLLRKQELGAVFQDPMSSLNPTMKIGAQVVEAAGSKKEALALLEAVGFPNAQGRFGAFPHELSGGLRQRVMIAMAIAKNPKLVIADEPTTALDVTVQSQILSLLRSLCNDLGTSFVFVTHDLGVAAQISDRIAVMYGGQIVEVGSSNKVLQNPSHPYTYGLLQSRLTLESDKSNMLPTLIGEAPDPYTQDKKCHFYSRCKIHQQSCLSFELNLIEISSDHLSACKFPDQMEVLSSFSKTSFENLSSTSTLEESFGNNATAVKVENLSKSFIVKKGLKRQKIKAITELNLAIAEGESVAIVGESGCGKSSLLRIIAGLSKPDNGSVQLGGKRSPQMVFQDAGASLTPWLTVEELILERIATVGIKKSKRSKILEAALQRVGLPVEVSFIKPPQLSGGQRQRVALARATAIVPEILLCDEPTSALDVSLAANVLNLISKLRSELGMAVLFVTHDLAVARVVADRIAVMYSGQIVELGPANQIVSNPMHPYTKKLFDSVPGPGKINEEKEFSLPDFTNSRSDLLGCPFYTRCKFGTHLCNENFPPSIEKVSQIGIHSVRCFNPLGYGDQ